MLSDVIVARKTLTLKLLNFNRWWLYNDLDVNSKAAQ
jgi:hypothetical protein